MRFLARSAGGTRMIQDPGDRVLIEVALGAGDAGPRIGDPAEAELNARKVAEPVAD